MRDGRKRSTDAPIRHRPRSRVCAHPAIAGTPTNLVAKGDLKNPGLSGTRSDRIKTPNGNTDDGTWWVSPWQPGTA